MHAAGLGGAVAAALVKHGITHIAQLQQHSPAQLQLLLGGQQAAKLADRLVDAGWGRDAAAVVDKGPPKSIQVRKGGGVSRCVGVGQQGLGVWRA